MQVRPSLRNEVALHTGGQTHEIDELLEAQIKAAVYVPQGMIIALDANPRMAAVWPVVVGEAVRLSFIHPDTKMLVLTATEIKRRIDFAVKAIDMMYNEQHFGLRQCYDMLFEVLTRALREAKEAADVAQVAFKPGRWTKDVPTGV